MKTMQPIFTRFWRSRWAAYLQAAGLAGITLLVRVIIGDRFEGPAMIMFTIPIILSAYAGGMGPGLLATVLSALGAAYFVLPPIFSFNVLSLTQRWQEAMLLLAGLIISFICETLHRSRRRAEKVIAQLQHKEIELEAAFAERKESEAISARLAAIVASSDDAIIGKDLNSIITSWNKSAERIFGYSAAEMVGTSIMRLIPAGRQDEENQILGKIKRGESLEHFETRRQTKAGRLIDVSVTVSPIKDATGGIIGVSKVARDITERRQMEAAIHDSEERFRTMANSMSQLAWIARADGFIFWYNQRWYEYTGTTPEQVEGWGWQGVHDSKMLPRVMENWQRAIAIGEPFEMEFPLRGADGKFRAFLTRGQPLKDSSGKVVQWFGTNTDVEIFKQAEEKIHRLNTELERRVTERTAQFEAANKELEAFSYSVSHDLRAPLRAVNGFAGIVIEEFGPQLPEAGRRYLERIRSGGVQMGMLIDDLLALSRLGRQPLCQRTVDTNQLVQAALADLEPQRAGRPVELRVRNLPAGQGDPALLKQVWVNLISNAIKYTRDRVPAVIEIGCEGGPGEPIFFVRDNGAGFDMRYAHKLFGVFQRLHRADEFEGTGVGLAIVQRIIHRHGGRVWAEGEEGRGAIFRFTLWEEQNHE